MVRILSNGWASAPGARAGGRAAAGPRSTSRSASTTVAPAPMSAAPIASPTNDAAPVTMATLPSRSAIPGLGVDEMRWAPSGQDLDDLLERRPEDAHLALRGPRRDGRGDHDMVAHQQRMSRRGRVRLRGAE